MNGSCAKCGKHGYLMHLHGEKGGPLFCPLCAGAWNAEHSRRRKFARIALKAMTLYLENGGSLSALDKFTSALALARLGMGSGVAGYRVDTIGNEIGDLTSELLADTLQLTHPDRHPPERRELAQRVTQELLDLKPFVFPAPKPKTPPPPRNGSEASRRETRKEPLQPAYPCRDCVEAGGPSYYCDACRAEYEKRRASESEKAESRRARDQQKRREQYARRARRRALCKIPPTCPACERQFRPARKDAVYCSSACRQRAHRQREALRLDGRPPANIEEAVMAGGAR
jgi:hypothetical protein